MGRNSGGGGRSNRSGLRASADAQNITLADAASYELRRFGLGRSTIPDDILIDVASRTIGRDVSAREAAQLLADASGRRVILQEGTRAGEVVRRSMTAVPLDSEYMPSASRRLNVGPDVFEPR